MTVIFKTPAEAFAAHDIMWKQKQVAQAIVRKALVDQTEAYVDMMCDGGGMEMGTTRDELQASLGGVKFGVEDMLDDLVADFAAEIKKQLKAVLYGAIVTGIKYDLAGGIKDVEVDVSINWE
jgi:hypothetical protein